MMHGLGSVRVVELSTGIAAGYLGKLFVGAGADVVKVESPAGDPLRRYRADGTVAEGRDGALFQFLNHGKRSVVGGVGDPHVESLVADTDVLVITEVGMDVEALVGERPELVVVSVTPYGREGPFADRPAEELVVQAESGALARRGTPERSPVMAGGRILEWAGGTYGAVAAAAALRGVQRSGVGTVVDVSLQEVGNLIGTSFIDLIMSLFGRPPLEHLPPPRALETPSIEPTLDGHVGFTANSREQFDSLLLLLGRPDLVGDEELATVTGRNRRLDEWLAVVRDFTTRHTTAEIVERASELRVPAVPVGNGATITELEHLQARAVFLTDPTGSFTMPRRPWRIDHEDTPAVRPAPKLGADTAAFAPRADRTGRPGPGGLPLEGVRVLDMSNWWAAPATAQLLASLGADVIKVESTRRPDGSRFNTVGMDPAALPERWWERSPIYSTVNTNKRGLTLDLTQERGLEVMKRLVARSDVVLENFTPRVLEQLGLTWDVIRDVNPRAILVRMPAFGLDGPWRDNPGFAQTMEQLSGLAWVTGYADGPPMNQGGVSDPVAGAHAAFALLVALAERDVTGVGCHVEVPMVEGALNTAAEQLLEYSAYGTLLTREGNRAPWGAPQNVYACRGHERWLALSVADEAQWLGLQAALGDPAWATDPQLDTHIGRRQRHDHLDAHLAAWAAALELDEAVAVLLDHGVPAGAVADPRTASTHPQLVARGFFEEVEHPVAGTHPLPTVPFRYGGIDRWIRRPAPTLGQHTREILRELCDLDDGDLDDLERMGVIGTMPRGL